MSDEQKTYKDTPRHPLERERIAELRALEVLDTAREERFDRITRMAASICDAPIVLLTLVDEERVWFKSRVGTEAEETSRNGAFCSQAILSPDPVFLVPDTRLDLRFKGHPQVTRDGGFRFYMATVLKGVSGLPLGALCVLDFKPRELSAEVVEQIKLLGEMASDELLRNSRSQSAHRDKEADRQVDTLTGLPAQAQFLDRLQVSIRDGESPSVAVVDLDDFSAVNRVLGHAAGDVILALAAGRLLGAAPSGATVARGQADEVLVMVPDPSCCCEALHMEDLQEVFQHGFEVDGAGHHITATMGAAASREHGDTAHDLLERARQARREARNRRLHLFIFDSPQEEALAERFLLGNELHRALKDGRQLRMVYQPKVRLGDGQLIGSEALMRWVNPRLGNVSPGRFVPVAEDIGLTPELGWFALNSTCESMRRWIDLGLNPPPVAVNLSAEDFDTVDFVPRLLRLLDQYKIPPSLLELEITERVIIRDPGSSARTIEALYEAGIKVGIDDFGTGYSSLSWLAELPVRALKIDRSFVTRVGERESAATLLGAIVDLAMNLGLESVAEGVETAEELAFVRARGCDTAQGYYFSRPLETEDYIEMLDTGDSWIQLVRPGYVSMVA